MNYSVKDLEKWNYMIENIVEDFGMNCYPQEFEIIDYNDMLGYEVYLGMPSRYPHWSFGKAYDKLKTLYEYNCVGLPYEMVINSNPCIAYLMESNTLLLQILTMAHVYGHNDFFTNNRLFKKNTDAKNTIEMFKNNADRIRMYINDPAIGHEKVEKILDAVHSIKLQTNRVIGVENSREDLLGVIMNYGRLLEWEKDIVKIVRDETKYFMPQIETKIINEGWASFCHYNILKKLNLSQELNLEFIKRHNDVVAPLEGKINPYFLGFKIFEDIFNKYGYDKIFEARLLERDESFIRKYLTKELCEKMNLFQYGKQERKYIVEEVCDENGFKEIRDTLCKNCGINKIPNVSVSDINGDILTLNHKFDGRELEFNYAIQTLKYLQDLWKGKIVLRTFMDGKNTSIICNKNKNIEYE